jgi:plastocyanin domain-containing protein
MTYTSNGLEPATLNLQTGKKYKIIIDSQVDVGGCMSTILLPGLDNTTQFVRKGNQITFEFTAKKTGTFGFTCAMGVSHNAQVIIQ